MSNNETNAGDSGDAPFAPPEPTASTPKSPSGAHIPSEREKSIQIIITKVILWMTAIGLFFFAVALVWAIGDLFSESKWEDFTKLSIQSQIFIVGIILLGIFFLVLFLVVFYKRGRKTIQKNLFKPITEEEKKKDDAYQIAKIVAAGVLISVFLIFVGLMIALIQFLLGNIVIQATGEFWDNLTGGMIALIIVIMFLLFDGLIYSSVYIWQNGHRWVIHSILMYNENVRSKYSFTKNQEITGKVIFGLIVLELVGIVFGLVWAIIESFTGDWGTSFRGYLPGIQISFYGIFAALFFVTMVFAMFFYKQGNNKIMTALFIQYKPKETARDSTAAKVITVGILTAITLITVGLIIWIVTVIIESVDPTGTLTLFKWLADKNGLSLLIYSAFAGVFTILALGFSYFLHNGYFWALEKILTLEKKIDEGLDDSQAKVEQRKKEKKKK